MADEKDTKLKQKTIDSFKVKSVSPKKRQDDRKIEKIENKIAEHKKELENTSDEKKIEKIEDKIGKLEDSLRKIKSSKKFKVATSTKIGSKIFAMMRGLGDHDMFFCSSIHTTETLGFNIPLQNQDANVDKAWDAVIPILLKYQAKEATCEGGSLGKEAKSQGQLSITIPDAWDDKKIASFLQEIEQALANQKVISADAKDDNQLMPGSEFIFYESKERNPRFDVMHINTQARDLTGYYASVCELETTLSKMANSSYLSEKDFEEALAKIDRLRTEGNALAAHGGLHVPTIRQHLDILDQRASELHENYQTIQMKLKEYESFKANDELTLEEMESYNTLVKALIVSTQDDASLLDKHQEFLESKQALYDKMIPALEHQMRELITQQKEYIENSDTKFKASDFNQVSEKLRSMYSQIDPKPDSLTELTKEMEAVTTQQTTKTIEREVQVGVDYITELKNSLPSVSERGADGITRLNNIQSKAERELRQLQNKRDTHLRNYNDAVKRGTVDDNMEERKYVTQSAFDTAKKSEMEINQFVDKKKIDLYTEIVTNFNAEHQNLSLSATTTEVRIFKDFVDGLQEYAKLIEKAENGGIQDIDADMLQKNKTELADCLQTLDRNLNHLYTDVQVGITGLSDAPEIDNIQQVDALQNRLSYLITVEETYKKISETMTGEKPQITRDFTAAKQSVKQHLTTIVSAASKQLETEVKDFDVSQDNAMAELAKLHQRCDALQRHDYTKMKALKGPGDGVNIEKLVSDRLAYLDAHAAAINSSDNLNTSLELLQSLMMKKELQSLSDVKFSDNMQSTIQARLKSVNLQSQISMGKLEMEVNDMIKSGDHQSLNRIQEDLSELRNHVTDSKELQNLTDMQSNISKALKIADKQQEFKDALDAQRPKREAPKPKQEKVQEQGNQQGVSSRNR